MSLKKSRFPILLSCWIGILCAGNFVEIIWRVLLHGNENSLWIPAIQGAGLLGVTAASFRLSSLRAARGFFLALLAFAAGDWACWLIESSSVWIDKAGALPVEYQMTARTLLSFIPALLMLLTLSGSGLGRKDVFISKGSLDAESRMPFGIRAVRWTILGPALAVIFVLPLVLQLTLTLHPNFSMAAKAMRALPAILVFAALNAVSEEFRFRSVLIARIHPVVGTGHTLLMTSALFGLAHWFGHPSGPTGVLLAGFAGWFWGKAMIETEGIGWSWLIHAAQDVAIVAFVIMAAR